MSEFKSAILLQNASVGVAVGPRSTSLRSSVKALGMAAILFSAGVAGAAQAQDRHAQQNGSDSARPPVIAQVVDVRPVRQSDSQSSNEGHHINISAKTIGGAFVGALLGHRLGGGDGKKATTWMGGLGGGVIANRLGKRRSASNQVASEPQGYDNARRVEDNNLVTVILPVDGIEQTYEIIQSKAIRLRPGDMVALNTTNDGKTLVAMPVQMEQEVQQTSTRPRPRR